MGQPVTWVAPYKFNTVVETNVDYRVMANYLLLYTTMLAFVNWKLYNMANLKYPPPVRCGRGKSICTGIQIAYSLVRVCVFSGQHGARQRHGSQRTDCAVCRSR